MAANYIVNVPKLRGRENYSEWQFAAENFLILEGMMKCIKPEEDARLFAEDDAKTKAKLILTIDSSLYVHIRNVSTTKDLWEKLKALFDDSGFARRITLLRNLISIRLENCVSMIAYVTQIIETGQKLCNTGFQLNDEWIGSLLLAGLPEKYAPMIMAIEHSGIQITTDAIKSKLLDMESENGMNGTNDESNSALVSGYKGGQHSSTARKSMVSKNHGGQNGGAVSTKTKKEIKCYRCKQIGHYKSQCTAEVSNNKGNERKQTNVFSAVFLSGNFNNQDWYVDSGASVHLTANKQWLTNISNEKKGQTITIADKTQVPIECSGDIRISTKVNDCNFDVDIKDVFCVPKLTTNLLSVSQLIHKGNKVVFTTNACEIYNRKGTLVAYALLISGVYKLQLQENMFAAAVISGELWHRRLGHVNSECLNKMQNTVDGLTLKEKVDITKSNCAVCCEGKQTRLPFTHVSERSTEVLNIIHTDICGPMECNSIGGYKYFILFVDDFSRMTAIYFLKNKNEALKSFIEYKTLVENQTNKKIKIIRSDNGREFCNAEFNYYLKKTGIVHQTTCPYTPEQNGLSERMNRTLVEKARCMLFDAQLSKKFWAEATNTAVYLQNRTGLSVLQGKTPYELWHGVKPDISHLRVFGSTVMTHIAKEKRQKWDKKAQKGILVGYADASKGYRVYDPVKNMIITSRDVIVVEKENTTIAVVEQKSVNETIKGTDQASSVGDMKESLSDTLTSQEESTNDSDSEYIPSEYEESLEETVTTTKEARNRKQPDRYGFSSQQNVCLQEAGVLTLQEALTGHEKEYWQKAVKEELQCFEENQAWELVEAPNNSDCVVQCKWVLKKKCDVDGKVLYRARLVAKGFTQRHGVDYNETFSPVVRYSTLRLLFALTVKLDFKTTHLDVKTAFLNGYLEEDIFMQKPDCFDDLNDGKVLKLKKAIYGLKQSSRMWYRKVEDCLCNIGYIKSKYEPCLFIKRTKTYITVIALYVDDFFIFSNDCNEVIKLKRSLGDNFKIKDLGPIRQCLGMRVVCNKNSVTLDQESYIDQLLGKFNMLDCHISNTPMECKLNLSTGNKCDVSIPYQRLIGSLMYLSVLTRPDISFSVSYMSQFNNCFTKEHWCHAKRILKYLKKTKHYALKYDSKLNSEIIGYVDADWGSDVIGRRSYTGFVFQLSGAAISWESRKQKVVALSSTEAEYIGISECCKEAIYLRNLQCEITASSYTIILYNDNQSAQKLLLNPVFHNRSKHIDIRFHFCKEIIAQNLVNVQYLCTADMPADLLTKSLNSIKHKAFVNAVGLVEK